MFKEDQGIAKLNFRDPEFLRRFKRHEKLIWKGHDLKSGGNPLFDQFKCERCGASVDIRDANTVKIGDVEHTVCDICKAKLEPKGFKEWLEAEEQGQPHESSKMKKSDFKEKISKGSRDLRDDLSKDYPGHLERHGDVGPFKILGSRGKSSAPVAR